MILLVENITFQTYIIISLFLFSEIYNLKSVFCDAEYAIIPIENEPFHIDSKHIVFTVPTPTHQEVEVIVDNNDKTDDQHSHAESYMKMNGYLASIRGTATESFRILIHDAKCSLQTTSTFARSKGCIYAVNGGPFQSYISGGCVGSVIVNGKLIQHSRNSCSINNGRNYSEVGFGMTYNNEWIIGSIPLPCYSTEEGGEQFDRLKVKEFVSGLSGWLINDRKIIPSHHTNDNKDFAPRTAIGVNDLGNLILFQVDGCEKCLYSNQQRKGLSLYQMAKIMFSPPVNASYAINLDGGGSSTSVKNGKVINHPTCLDYIDWNCERRVASVVCIQSNGKAFDSTSTKN